MRKHRDKPFKDWNPEEEEDDEDPLWDEEDDIIDDYVIEDKLNQSNGNSTTKVSKNRG